MNQAERRQARVKKLVLNVLAQQAIDVQVDKHGVYTARIPIDAHADTEWHFAFDKDVAHDRAADYVSYVNPRFQQLLRRIDEGPVIALHYVRGVGSDAGLVQARFAWHIKYSSYGETREDLFSTKIGELPDGALTTDAFEAEGSALTEEVEAAYQEATDELEKHIEGRMETFMELVEANLEAEKSRLQQYEGPNYATTKKDQEAELFYRTAVERHLSELKTKYEIHVAARLVTVDIYRGRE